MYLFYQPCTYVLWKQIQENSTQRSEKQPQTVPLRVETKQFYTWGINVYFLQFNSGIARIM